jgi:Domain of unknown function (DUF1772)
VLFGLLAYLNTLDWRWLLGAIVLLANWPYTLFVIAPTNNRLMDTPPEAATAETRRMLERWGALHAGRSALGPRGNVDLFVGSAVRLLLTPAFRSRVAAFAQGTTVDRNSVAGLGASHDNRPGYRSQGMPVASPREWCRGPHILDIVEGAANLDCELLAGIDGHRRRRAGIARDEGIRSDLSSCAAPLCVADAQAGESSTRGSVTPAQPKPMRPQRSRSTPITRATTARPRSAMLLGSAEGRPRAPIGRTAMAS